MQKKIATRGGRGVNKGEHYVEEILHSWVGGGIDGRSDGLREFAWRRKGAGSDDWRRDRRSGGRSGGGSENRLLGALLGGAIGAGGGYLIGANWDKITGKDSEGAQAASREAQTEPATVHDA